MTPNPCIIWSFGPKALKYDSLEPYIKGSEARGFMGQGFGAAGRGSSSRCFGLMCLRGHASLTGFLRRFDLLEGATCRMLVWHIQIAYTCTHIYTHHLHVSYNSMFFLACLMCFSDSPKIAVSGRCFCLQN